MTAPVPFVLYQITNLDEHGPLQVAISERVIDVYRGRAIEDGVVLALEDAGIAAACAIRSESDDDVHVESMNEKALTVLGEGSAVGVGDTLVCWAPSLGGFIATNFMFAAEGEGLSTMARELRRGRHIGGCCIFRPEEDDALKGGREIRKVVSIDAERWVAAKQARRAKA